MFSDILYHPKKLPQAKAYGNIALLGSKDGFQLG